MADADKEGPVIMQPGQVISPGGGTSPPQPAPAPPPAPAPAKTPAPQPPASKPAPVPVAPPEPAVAPQAAITQDESTISGDDSGVSWTASEFVAHEKSATWYLSLAAVAAVLSAIVFLVSHDVISTIVVVVAALILGIYGARKPRQLVYTLDEIGIGIGQKHFPYELFRSFSILPEGAFSSIVLMPLKRFSPLITIYFSPDDEDVIAGILSDRLPYAEFRYDAVDRLMRRIRF